MNEADARALLEDQTQWNVAPVLTSDEVDRLLARARINDTYGYPVDDPNYTDTWSTASVNRATSLGWRTKAAKVAAQYDVATGGGTAFQRSQQYQMCLKMAQQFGSGIGFVQLQASSVERWP